MGKFTMRLLRVTWILCLASTAFGQDNGDCVEKNDACGKKGVIATISCKPEDSGHFYLATDPSESTTTQSTPTTTTEAPPCTVDKDGYDYLLEGVEDMDKNICRKKCKIQAKNETETSKKCKFWRFEKTHDNVAECSLQTDCGEYVVGDCQDPYYCNSGQLGCYPNGDPILPCTLTAPTDYVPNEFHIICTDEDAGDINLYSAAVIDEPIPGDTVCHSIRMCAAWNEQDDDEQKPYYRRAAIICDGKDKTWKPTNDTGSKDASNQMIGDGSKISEPTCATRCDP